MRSPEMLQSVLMVHESPMTFLHAIGSTSRELDGGERAGETCRAEQHDVEGTIGDLRMIRRSVAAGRVRG